MSRYKAVVYGTGKDSATAQMVEGLKQAGVETTVHNILEHPDKVEKLKTTGEQRIPLVEIEGPDGNNTYDGYQPALLEAITYFNKQGDTNV